MAKIALAGSHSTGKTTLIRDFCAQQGTDKVYVISGIARGVIARGFQLGKGSTVEAWINYIGDQFRAERIAATATWNVLLSDRTAIDALAYALVNRDLLGATIPSYFIDMLLEVALRESAFYDLYAFFPVEFPMASDGIRDEDEGYRSRVGDAILRILEENKVKFLTISGTRESRLFSLTGAVAGHRIAHT